MMLILKQEIELESILEDQICLVIPQETQTEIWELLQGYSYPAARWMAYLNRLSLEYIIPYFKQTYGCDIELADNPIRPDSVWEYVNGFALTIDGKRVIVIPSETDSDEFSIPFEWIDIDAWAGEYYLAVQIRPDSGWLRVFGFTTHQQIKQKAEYDKVMRTYTLSQEQIIDDMDVLLTSLAIASNQKAAIPALTAIGQPQKNKYLEALKRPKLYSPRLDLDADHWATFVSDDKLREKLWEMRMRSPLQEMIETGIISISNMLEKMRIHGANFTDSILRESETLLSQPITQPQFVTGFRSPAVLESPKTNTKFRDELSLPSDITVPNLILFIQSNKPDIARIHALQLLGDIGYQNQEAIAFVSGLQGNPQEELSVRREAAVCLGKIDRQHPQSGLRRVQLIDLTYSLGTVNLSLEITIMPIQEHQAHVHFYLTNSQEKKLPNGLKFEAIDSDGDSIFSIQESNREFYQGSFVEDYGGYFWIQIVLDDASVRSEFIV
ncbi:MULTISPECIES: DUF1822 family protein [Pseudanabaena]|uniref:DUF1822 family protein n=1 Tax=Pseudanabaena TaxID=1152 RepID=UPI0024790EA5|nr:MULTISPECIES: DUF1822 family protein [Pseudanabaena]MEA5485930.1 DUF1822 family protein [Pseudanabaena sp. CCNP1317]WGS71348.1 DUF1822 family protein [Pseudanabaena galeata CCNP1313]